MTVAWDGCVAIRAPCRTLSLCWARRFGSGRHAWMCGRNVGEFVSAQMEANCIQSDSWAVVSQIIWLWVSRHLSVHMIHGSSQGLMLVIGVSKCRGIHWCSNILLLYHLPGKVLGQPHLWCGVCIWILGFSRAQKFTHRPRLRHLKMVKMSWTFIPFAKRTSWTGVPSSHTRSWKGDQSLNRLRMRWKLLVTVNCWVAFQINLVQRCTSSMVLACGRRRFKQSLEVIEARSFWI